MVNGSAGGDLLPGIWGCPPDFEIPLESPFAKVGTDEEVQRDAAGVRGVPKIVFSVPHDWGIKGG